MKAIVLAYHSVGCAGIEALLEAGYEIAAVFTHTDNPNENIWFDSVAELATQKGIPVYASEDINHPVWEKRIAELKPDILFSLLLSRYGQGSNPWNSKVGMHQPAWLAAAGLPRPLPGQLGAAPGKTRRCGAVARENLTTGRLALFGTVAALLATGTSLNIVSFLGAIIGIGIVAKNGILMLDRVDHLVAGGLPLDEALVQCGRRRLRPVLMTSLTTLLGLLPIAYGIGSGVDMLRPLAIAVMGALATSVLLSLIATPVFYRLLCRPKP